VDLVLDIDVQGARQLKGRISGGVSIFILPPSRQILEQRLRARSQDSEQVIERRLREAAEEIRNYSQYDYVLVNREVTVSVDTLGVVSSCPRGAGVNGWSRKSFRFWRLLKMAETTLKQTAHNVIPDDPELSAYRFIIVAAKRARQLQNGARSFLPTTPRSRP
jgi:hypothetical protein